uniref:NAC domain-containing protein n=1 Tax=Ananas comosus var. bracteatus TaxID=296719 RepID=A0A6V7PZJ3_ANACO|nr:unnamed protein product [Ananas comosus var. bracteatus]
MGLRDIESTLPPGFRFYPSDEELVCHYLYKKVANEKISEGTTMIEVDLHAKEPWELPEVAKLSANEWYFFSFRDRKYATGSRTNRATKSGYWKATGKDREVHDPSTRTVVGMRKTLVFYRGRAPNGVKSGWVMHEFRLDTPHSPPKEDWVLCRVFHKRKGEGEQDHSVGSSCEHAMGSSPPMVEDPMTMMMGHHEGGCRDMVSSSSHPLTNPHQEDHNSNSYMNLALLHYSFIDIPQDVMMGLGPKGGDDECGFMFDVGMDDDHNHNDHGMVGMGMGMGMGMGVASLGDMSFQYGCKDELYF